MVPTIFLSTVLLVLVCSLHLATVVKGNTATEELHEAEVALEEAILNSIRIDFNIYNKNEDFVISIMTDDGHKLCSGRISRKHANEIDCHFDPEILQRPEIIVLTTCYGTISKEIVSQKTTRFRNPHGNKLASTTRFSLAKAASDVVQGCKHRKALVFASLLLTGGLSYILTTPQHLTAPRQDSTFPTKSASLSVKPQEITAPKPVELQQIKKPSNPPKQQQQKKPQKPANAPSKPQQKPQVPASNKKPKVPPKIKKEFRATPAAATAAFFKRSPSPSSSSQGQIQNIFNFFNSNKPTSTASTKPKSTPGSSSGSVTIMQRQDTRPKWSKTLLFFAGCGLFLAAVSRGGSRQQPIQQSFFKQENHYYAPPPPVRPTLQLPRLRLPSLHVKNPFPVIAGALQLWIENTRIAFMQIDQQQRKRMWLSTVILLVQAAYIATKRTLDVRMFNMNAGRVMQPTDYYIPFRY